MQRPVTSALDDRRTWTAQPPTFIDSCPAQPVVFRCPVQFDRYLTQWRIEGARFEWETPFRVRIVYPDPFAADLFSAPQAWPAEGPALAPARRTDGPEGVTCK